VRQWIARANVLLAGGVLALGASLLWAHGGLSSRTSTSPTELFLPLDLLEGGSPRTGPGFQLNAFLDDLARLHGRPPCVRPERPEAAPQGKAEDPALTTLAIAGILRSANGPDLVLIRSKDPANPLSCQLCEGEEEHGVRLVRLRYEGAVARVLVRRGDREHVLSFQMGEGTETSLIRDVRPEVARNRVVADVETNRSFDSGSIKSVPFFDEAGRRVGVRVTGIDPSSRWRASGLSPGDVITALDGRAVSNAEALAHAIRAARGSLEVTVRGATSGVSRALVVDAR
jgi:hypothetical protein